MNIKAIYAIYPKVKSTREGKAYDIDGNEVAIDTATVNAWVDAEAYKDLRRAEYPSIQDQLDTLYHGGYDAWKAAIQAVKDKYPKE